MRLHAGDRHRVPLMQDPRKLQVYERGLRLSVAVYRLTDGFPASQRFVLAAQMQRAAISISSNIAEGCGRRSARELHQFLHIALGSARELGFQLRPKRLIDYGGASAREEVREELDRVERMLNCLAARVSVAARRSPRSQPTPNASRPTPH
jgi:four helix bundle protein